MTKWDRGIVDREGRDEEKKYPPLSLSTWDLFRYVERVPMDWGPARDRQWCLQVMREHPEWIIS